MREPSRELDKKNTHNSHLFTQCPENGLFWRAESGLHPAKINDRVHVTLGGHLTRKIRTIRKVRKIRGVVLPVR